MADFVKLDRLNRLNEIVNEVAEERAQRFLGRTLPVRRIPFEISCVDEPAHLGISAYTISFTRNNIVCVGTFKSNELESGLVSQYNIHMYHTPKNHVFTSLLIVTAIIFSDVRTLSWIWGYGVHCSAKETSILISAALGV